MADEGTSVAWRAELLPRFAPRDPACAGLVLSLLENDGDSRLRRAAGITLEISVGSSRPRANEWQAAIPIERLAPLLEHQDEEVRERVVSHLIHRDEPEITELLLTTLSESRSTRIRGTVLRGLRMRSDCTHRAFYLRELRRSPSVSHRGELHHRYVCSSTAMELAVGLVEVRHRSELRPYLGRLSRERGLGRGEVGEAILSGLLRLFADTEDVWMRADIIKALADIDLPAAREEVLRRFTSDPAFQNRGSAAVALGMAPDETGERLLVDWLTAHPELGDSDVGWIRRLVAEALAHHRTARALEALTHELELAENLGRSCDVLRALSLRADAGAASVLREHFGSLREETPLDCTALAITLRFRFELRYAAENGAELDSSLVDDARTTFRRCADARTHSLTDILDLWMRHRDVSLVPLLRELEADHPNRRVRGRAAVVLAELTRSGTR